MKKGTKIRTAMKDSEKNKKVSRNKPFIPKAPDQTYNEPQDPNDPNPNSDPNYSYFPNSSYPTGPEDE